MKPRINPFLSPLFASHRNASLIVVGSIAALLACLSAQATSGTWLNSGANANWTTTSNWFGGTVPGSTVAITGTNANPDIATFNTAVGTYGTSGNPILIDSASENIAGITFTGSSIGSYFIGTTGGNSLYLSSGGSIAMGGNGVVGLTINAPLVIEGASGTYTLQNDWNNGSSLMTVNGQISGGNASATTLTLTGTQSGSTFNAVNGNVINGLATSLAINKSGIGTWILTGTNTYTGGTTVSLGTLSVNGASGQINGTSSVTLANGATFNLGDATNGLANRINTAATLTLGSIGGTSTVNIFRGSATANSQSLASLTVNAGTSTIQNNGTTGGVPTLTFSGANPYIRNAAGFVNLVGGANMLYSFTNAPSGTGNVAGGLLIGAILNNTDFIAAASGTASTPTYTANTWSAGTNTNITASNGSAFTGTTNSLRFNTGAFTATLSGATTITSGGIMVGSGATSGTVTGGWITTGAAGGEMWLYTSGKPLTINSNILDNGTSSLSVGGTNTVTLGGTNTYAGVTTVNTGATLINNGTTAGNVTVNPSTGANTSNLTNNGTISGTLTIKSSPTSTPIAAQGNAVISGNVTLNAGSSTGAVLNDGQLTIAGASAATVGTISSTGTGSGASAGTGAVVITNSGGSSLTFAAGSSFARIAPGNGGVVNLTSLGTTSAYSYGQNNVSSTQSQPFTANFNGGTFNIGQVGQNNSGAFTAGTTNLLGGTVFNLAPIAANGWSGIAGASQGGGFMHGIWNIGGATAGTLNITGGFSQNGGVTTVPAGTAINGLQFTVGNGGTLTTTTASSVGFAVGAQAAGQTTAQTTNSLTVNSGGTATTAGNFTLANGIVQTATTTFNTLAVNGGTFSNSGGVLYIGNNNFANTFTETNTVTVAGGTLNQAGGAVSLGASNTAATNYANILNVSSGALNIGTSASNQALQLGTASNTAATVSNTVNLSGGKLIVSGQISALAGTGQVNTFNWTGGQLTAGTVTATSATWAAAGGGGIASGILNNTAGTFAPGDIGTGGKTTVTGGYTQGASGTLAIDLGSTAIATAFQSGAAFYDTIAMTGALTLGGNLNVSLINSFGSTITSGNSFNIITGATSASVAFSNVDAAGRVNLLTGGSIGVSNTSSTVTLSNYSSGASLIWAGNGGTNAWDVATTSDFIKGGVTSVFNNGDLATFNNSGLGNSTVNLNTTVSPGGVTFGNTSGTYTVTGSGKISGASTVTVSGAGGTVALNTANDYTGGTTVSAGTLRIGNATALGGSAGAVSVASGAVLDLNGQTVANTNALALNGMGITNGGALINSGSAASYAGLVTFSTGTSIGGAGSFTLSGGIAATAATNNLIKTGAGTVTLSAAATTNRSTATATTQIDNGVLRISNASALATGTTAINTVNNGGTLQVTGGITLDQPITLNTGSTLSSDGTNTSQGKATVSATANASVTLSTVSSGDVFTVGNGSNDVSGGSSNSVIHIAGPGSVLLSNASDYTGNWSVDAGTLLLQSSTSDLGATNTATLTLNGGKVTGQFTQSGGNRSLTGGAGNNVIVSANSTITSDVTTSTTGITYTFGSLAIGAQTLTAAGGSNVTGGTAGVTFGSTTLSGNATFNVTAPTGGATLLTLGTLSLVGNNLTTSGTGSVVGGSTTLGGAVSVSIGANAPLTLGAITDGGNQLTLTGAGNFAQSAAWASGTAGGLTLGVSGGTTYSGAATLNQANTFTGGVTLNSGTLVANTNVGALGAAGGVTLAGGQLQILDSTARTFTNGNTTVTANSTILANRTSAGAGTTQTLGTLGIGAQTLTVNLGTATNVTSGTEGLTFGAVTLSGGATFTINNNTSGGTGLLTVGAITNGANSLTLKGNGNFAQTGVYGSGAGGLTLDSTYTGTATLSQSNTFTGGVIVNGGTLSVTGTSMNTGSVVNSGATGTGNVTFNNTASLSSNGNVWYVPTVTLNGTLNLTGSSRIRLGYNTLDLGYGAGSGNRTININNVGKPVTGGNTLAGGEGTGQYGLETQSALSSTGTIQNGTLDLQTAAFSSGTYGMFLLGSMTYTNASVNVGPNVLLGLNGNQTGGNINVQSGGIMNLTNNSRSIGLLSGGGNVFNSMITTGTNAAVLTVTATSGSADFSGVLANGPAGSLGFTKAGAGSTQTLSGANTYTGTTTISAGTLSVGSINSVAGGTASSNLGAPITVANGTIGLGATTTAGQLTYTGTGETTDRVLNLAGTTGGGVIDQSGTGLLKFTSNLTATGAGLKTLTVQGSTAGTGEISGKIVDNSSTNITSVSKSGTGTWTLSGANTYTGATTVSAGVLAVNGTLANTTTTVTGGRLQGSGSIVGSVTIDNGGTLAPGNSIESLGTGALSFLAGSTYSYELDATAASGSRGDLTYSSGTLTIASGTILSLNELAAGSWTNGTKLALISYFSDGGLSGWNNGLFTYGSAIGDDTNITIGSQSWLFNYNDTSVGSNFTSDQTGNRFVTITAIPEPNVAALIGGFGVLALLRRRR